MMTYDSYKDTNIEWFSKIPLHWKIAKIKYLFDIGRGRVIPQEELKLDGNYPVYSSQTKNNGCLGYINTYDYDEELITWTTDGVNAGTIFLRKGKFNCTNICGTLKSKTNNSNTYIKYILQIVATNNKRPDTNGAKIMNNEMAELKIILPLPNEQKAIASFLDKKCSNIENFISQKTKHITYLKELKTAIINECVTKGLDKTATCKESGIEWLGKIPSHWKMINLWILFKENKLKNTNMQNSNLLSLSYGQIIRKNIKSNFGLLPTSFETYQIVNKGNIILRLTDLQNDHKSLRTGYVKEKGIITSAYIGLYKISNLVKNEKYFQLLLHSFDTNKGFYNMGSGVRQGLSYNELKNFIFPVPPPEEQKQIATHIEKKLDIIDKLIEKTTKEIDFVKEYKTSLIDEVVSGKRKVIGD